MVEPNKWGPGPACITHLLNKNVPLVSPDQMIFFNAYTSPRLGTTRSINTKQVEHLIPSCVDAQICKKQPELACVASMGQALVQMLDGEGARAVAWDAQTSAFANPR